jgi:hypothetical protein
MAQDENPTLTKEELEQLLQEQTDPRLISIIRELQRLRAADRSM